MTVLLLVLCLGGCAQERALKLTPPVEPGPAYMRLASTTGEQGGLAIDPLILWGGGGLLAAALIAVVLILLLRRKRKARSRADVPAEEQKPRGIRVANIQGIGTRRNQQDSFGVTDVSDASRSVLAVVADGVGGTANGAEISRLVTSHFLQVFQPEQDNPAEFLLRAVSGAQSAVRSFLEGKPAGGSTVVAVFLKDGGLHFLSVGDSRVCLLRGGALIQLNREHNLATRLDEQAARGEISPAEARNDPQRASLTSYIGMEAQLQIDGNARPIPLTVGDRLLLMTDGVFGTLSEAALTAAVSLPNIQEAGARLEQAVTGQQKQNQDNFTALNSASKSNIQYDEIKSKNLPDRSEERRVGKECRSRWSPYH